MRIEFGIKSKYALLAYFVAIDVVSSRSCHPVSATHLRRLLFYRGVEQIPT